MEKTILLLQAALDKGFIDSCEVQDLDQGVTGLMISARDDYVGVRIAGKQALLSSKRSGSEPIVVKSDRLDSVLGKFIFNSLFGSSDGDTFKRHSVVSDRSVYIDPIGRRWIDSSNESKVSLEFYNAAALKGADPCLLLLPGLYEYTPGFKIGLQSSRISKETSLSILLSSIDIDSYAVLPNNKEVFSTGINVNGGFLFSKADFGKINSVRRQLGYSNLKEKPFNFYQNLGSSMVALKLNKDSTLSIEINDQSTHSASYTGEVDLNTLLLSSAQWFTLSDLQAGVILDTPEKKQILSSVELTATQTAPKNTEFSYRKEPIHSGFLSNFGLKDSSLFSAVHICEV